MHFGQQGCAPWDEILQALALPLFQFATVRIRHDVPCRSRLLPFLKLEAGDPRCFPLGIPSA